MSPDQEPKAVAQTATFAFARLIVRKACFEQIDRVQPAPGEERPKQVPASINIGFGVQIGQDGSEGQLTLTVNVAPDPKWHPYKIEVVVSGLFKSKDATSEVFDQFCKFTAPSILFPYVRQVVHSLTMDGVAGPIKLDPVNIERLVANAVQTRKAAAVGSQPSEP